MPRKTFFPPNIASLSTCVHLAKTLTFNLSALRNEAQEVGASCVQMLHAQHRIELTKAYRTVSIQLLRIEVH